MTAPAPTQIDRLLKLPEVREMVGLGTTSIYQLIKEGKFPNQVRCTARAVRWRLSEVQAFIAGTWTGGE